MEPIIAPAAEPTTEPKRNPITAPITPPITPAVISAKNGATAKINKLIVKSTTASDGLGVMNETGNYIIPKYIQNQPRPKNIGKGIWNKGITRELAEQSKFRHPILIIIISRYKILFLFLYDRYSIFICSYCFIIMTCQEA